MRGVAFLCALILLGGVAIGAVAGFAPSIRKAPAPAATGLFREAKDGGDYRRKITVPHAVASEGYIGKVTTERIPLEGTWTKAPLFAEIKGTSYETFTVIIRSGRTPILTARYGLERTGDDETSRLVIEIEDDEARIADLYAALPQDARPPWVKRRPAALIMPVLKGVSGEMERDFGRIAQTPGAVARNARRDGGPGYPQIVVAQTLINYFTLGPGRYEDDRQSLRLLSPSRVSVDE